MFALEDLIFGGESSCCGFPQEFIPYPFDVDD